MISVIVTSLNEPPQLLVQTLLSIRETAPGSEIIVVDDCSATPVVVPPKLYTRIIHNKHRCGVGPSRTIGVLHARHPNVLICDSHMIFPKDWLSPVENTLLNQHDAVLCFSCVDMDVDKSVYVGATINIDGPDRANPSGRHQILEGVWMKERPATLTRVACVMGGAYAMTKEWFLKLSPLYRLRGWGSDEVMLSVKSHRAGGSCLVMPDIKIKHKFKSRAPYATPLCYPTYNKLFAIHVLCSPSIAQALHAKLKAVTPANLFRPAETMFFQDWHLVAAEQAYNQTIFTVSFENYARQFNLAMPC